MTAITFPNSPSSGDTHTAGNGIVYTYDGEKWTSIGTNSAGTWTRSGTTVSLTNAGDDLNVDSGTLFVDASTDRVGVGTTSPGGKLVVSDGSLGFQFDPVNGTGCILRSLTSGGSRDSLLFDATQYVFSNGATEYSRIDSSGRLLVGQSSSPSSGSGQYSKIFVAGYVGGTPGGASISIARDEAATAMSHGDSLGALQFTDNNGNTFATVSAATDAASGSNDYPGRLAFNTTADGASGPTERVRIDNSGQLLIIDANAATYTDFITSTSRGEYNQTGTTQKIIFPNEYAAGNDDTRQKLYLFNSGGTRQAIGTGNAYDLTYHSSGQVANVAHHRFYVDKVEKVRINTYGVAFNGDSASANSLDDYEEGTFTPVLAYHQGATQLSTVSPVATSYKGRYTKIGDRVYFDFYTRYNLSGGTPNNANQIRISGLPFAQGTNVQQYAAAHIGYLSNFYSSPGSSDSNHYFPGAYVQDNANSVVLTINLIDGGEAMPTLSTNTSAGIMVSGSYSVNNS